jgi:hypothetical protein
MDPTLNMSDLNLVFFIPVLAMIGYGLMRVLFGDKRRKYMPSRVPGIPLVNQTYIQLSPQFPLKLRQWAAEYGEIYCTRSAATDFIWLGSPKLIKEIIDRRSAIYSSRAPLPFAAETASGGRRLTLMPKGPRWRSVRTIIHRVRVSFKGNSW